MAGKDLRTANCKVYCGKKLSVMSDAAPSIYLWLSL